MTRYTFSLLTCAGALAWSSAAAAYPLPFPARGNSIADDEHFVTDGHGSSYAGKGGTSWAMDIVVRRFNGTQWTGVTDGATAPYSFEEDVSYGTPLFSSTDGVVIGCWNGLPDGPDRSTNNCDPSCPTGHTLAGNHLVIETPSGDHAILYAHLAQGSIPPELCPIVDADGLIDDMGTSCSDGGSGLRNSTRLDSFFEHDDLPVIHRGDYIGEMGHSGNSWNPHLHLQVYPFNYDDQDNPCLGPSEPIEFVETWTQPAVSGEDADPYAWDPLTREVLPVTPETGNFLVSPDPIGAAKGTLYLGAGDMIDVETDTQGGVVAYRNAGGELRLRSFYIGIGDPLDDDTGDLTYQDTRSEGAVLSLDLVKLPVNERDYVAVVRTQSGNLKVIPYSADYTTGEIVRMPGARQDGVVRALAASPSPTHNGAVVAVRTNTDTLKVIDYASAPGTLAITRPGSAASSPSQILDVAITTVDAGFKGVVTAEVGPFWGGITLRSFAVSAAGDVTAVDSVLADALMTDVELATVDGLLFPIMGAVAVAMRDASGNLRLQTWSVSPGGILELVDEGGAGQIDDLSVAPTGGRDFVTGVSASGDDLYMISWGTDWAADTLRRSGTRTGIDINEVDLASFHRAPGTNTIHPRYRHLLAGVQTSAGYLRVLSYATNYDNWY